MKFTMKTSKSFLCAIVLGLLSCTGLHATPGQIDVGETVNGAAYISESETDDPSIIQRIGTTVGYIGTLKEEDPFEYMSYGLASLEGATHFTVSASSGSQGGTLYVRLSTPFNPTRTLATVDIPNTGGWGSFKEFSVDLNTELLRVANSRGFLYLVVVQDDAKPGYLFDIASFRFDSNSDDVDTVIQAEDFDLESYPSDDDNIRRMNTKVSYITPGSYITFSGFDFGNGASSFSVVASAGSLGGTVVLTTGAPLPFGQASEIGRVDIPDTYSWDNFEMFYTNLDAPVSGKVNRLYLNFVGSEPFLFDIDSFQFGSTPIDDVGEDIAGGAIDGESEPDDPSVIHVTGDTLGYIKADDPVEYWYYGDFKFGSGAKTLTVRASSATDGGILTVRLNNHYNPTRTVAVVDIPNTGGWDKFQDITVPVNESLVANQNGAPLFFVVSGDETTNYQFDIKSFRFDR